MYRKFNLNKEVFRGLTKSELKVLKILEDIVKDAEVVYQRQLTDGFYPKGITKKELEGASKKNPDILSPFTYVSKKDGKLAAESFCIRYADLLRPLAKKIEQAASFSQNKAFKKYLIARAKSLLGGNYAQADILWLDVKDSKLDFNIGFCERYLDKILFIKRAFQSHVGIVNKEKTDKIDRIKEIFYASAKLSYDKHHTTNIPKKGVTLLSEDTPATSGFLADVVFSGEHFPCDLNIMQEYGSRIIIYRTQSRLKFDKLHYPIFKAIFERKFASKYSEEELVKAANRRAMLTELSRQLHKFPGARERLKEHYGVIDEANAAVSGIQHSKHLLVKGVFNQDELEATMILQIVWIFSDWLLHKRTAGISSHSIGNLIVLNFYLKSGALKVKEGIYWPNFYKVFFEAEVLADKLAHLLQEGTYEEADNFIKANADLSNFKKLSKNLSGIPITI